MSAGSGRRASLNSISSISMPDVGTTSVAYRHTVSWRQTQQFDKGGIVAANRRNVDRDLEAERITIERDRALDVCDGVPQAHVQDVVDRLMVDGGWSSSRIRQGISSSSCNRLRFRPPRPSNARGTPDPPTQLASRSLAAACLNGARVLNRGVTRQADRCASRGGRVSTKRAARPPRTPHRRPHTLPRRMP